MIVLSCLVQPMTGEPAIENAEPQLTSHASGESRLKIGRTRTADRLHDDGAEANQTQRKCVGPEPFRERAGGESIAQEGRATSERRRAGPGRQRQRRMAE